MSQSSIILYDVLATAKVLAPQKFHEFSRICGKFVFDDSETAKSITNKLGLRIDDYYVEGRNYYFDLYDYKFMKDANPDLFQYFTVINCPYTVSAMLQCTPQIYLDHKKLPDLDIDVITSLLSTYALSYYIKFSGQFDNYYVIYDLLSVDKLSGTVLAVKEAPIKTPERFYLKALCDLLGENMYQITTEAEQRLAQRVNIMMEDRAKQRDDNFTKLVGPADIYFETFLSTANGRILKDWVARNATKYSDKFRATPSLKALDQKYTDKSEWKKTKLNIVDLVKSTDLYSASPFKGTTFFERLWAIHEFINLNMPKDIYRLSIAVNNMDTFMTQLAKWLDTAADNLVSLTPDLLNKYGIKELLTCKTDVQKQTNGNWVKMWMIKLWGFIEIQVYLNTIPALEDHRLYEIRRVQNDVLKLRQLMSDNTLFNKVLIHCKDVAYKSIMDGSK